MKYVYAALLLHAAGKEIDENGISKLIEATGSEVNKARVQSLVAALADVNIEEAIKAAAVPAVIATPAETSTEEEAPPKEEKEEEEEEAFEGLGSLFG
jgi:large subunit ribosomal protein L12